MTDQQRLHRRDNWIKAREAAAATTWACPPSAKRSCDFACRECGEPMTAIQVDLPACPSCGYAESMADFHRRLDEEA
jgi:ribosomal protein L37E